MSVKKKLTIETAKEKLIFKIEEYSGKYHLYELTYGGWLGGKEKLNKIGESKSLEDAVTLAKVSVSGTIIKIELEDY